MNVSQSEEAVIVNYLFPPSPNTPKITHRGDITGGISEGGPSSYNDLSASQNGWYGDILIVLGIFIAAILVSVALGILCYRGWTWCGSPYTVVSSFIVVWSHMKCHEIKRHWLINGVRVSSLYP